MTLVFAHRGSKGTRPENTLAAFEEAIRVGSDGIELDVHLSKDQELVVIHDEKINRTTSGTGYVKDYTLAELKAFDAGSWFDEKYKNETIPSLAEVLQLLTKENYQGILNIEIKTDKIQYPWIEKLLAKMMKNKPWSFKYMYSSFNFETLNEIHSRDPGAEVALILRDSKNKINMAMKTPYIKAVHSSIDWVERQGKKIKEFPLPVRPWTVNKVESMVYCFSRGVEAFHTDYPEKAVMIKELMEAELLEEA